MSLDLGVLYFAITTRKPHTASGSVMVRFLGVEYQSNYRPDKVHSVMALRLALLVSIVVLYLVVLMNSLWNKINKLSYTKIAWVRRPLDGAVRGVVSSKKLIGEIFSLRI